MNDTRDTSSSSTHRPSRPGSLLHRVIGYCLDNKLVVILITSVFVAWGVMVAPFDWDLGGIPRDPVPVDAIPDIGENQQLVFTEWMGRSPQDVEDLCHIQRGHRVLLVTLARARKAELSAQGNTPGTRSTGSGPGRHGAGADLLVHARGP